MDAKKRAALGRLAGRFPFRSWATGEMLVPEVVILPKGVVDDASRMNRTGVAEVWDIPADPAAAEEQLRTLIRRAKAERRRVAIASAA